MDRGFGNRKRLMILFGAIIVLLGIGVTWYANRENNWEKPPAMIVLMNNEVRREALLGTYEWRDRGEIVHADSDHPTFFEYGEISQLDASKGQKLYLSVSKDEGEFMHSVTAFEVYEKGNRQKISDASYTVNGDTIVLDIKESSGEYVYRIHVDYDEKGDAEYGLSVNVDLQSFPLEELKGMRTPYIGNHGKVAEILAMIPVPGSGYVQRYLALQTEMSPYGLTGYYEPKAELAGNLVMPTEEPENEIYMNMEKNALILLSLIENAEKVSFKVRNTPSGGVLEDREYSSFVTFLKEELEEKYGPLDDILDQKKIFE